MNKKVTIGTGLAALAGAVMVTTSVTHGAGAVPTSDLQAAKAASAKYHSLEEAVRDGFSGEHEPCVESPDGGMGIHHVNRSLIGDRELSPTRPEILLYQPDEGGKLTLVGLEWMVFDADQDLSTDADRPSLFGHPFDGPMPGHAPGMPIHYDLHVWLWQDNPSGLFAPFNPSLSCPSS
jgi:hypothetical protein